MGDMVVKEMLDPVDRRCSNQDTHQVRMDAAHSAWSMGMRLYGLIITSLGFVVPLLRRIYWCIASEQDKGLSKEIQRLKQGLSGIPVTVNDLYGMEELRKLLGNQLNEVCRDFQRVSQNLDVSLLLRSMLSKSEGPKRVSDVRDIAGIIGKHLELKREMIDLDFQRQEITEDEFFSMIERGPVKIGYSPNRECVELNVAIEGAGDCSKTLQPEVKEAVSFVSRNIGGTGGGIHPFVGRIRRRLGTFKKRLRVVMTRNRTRDVPFYVNRNGRLVVCKRSFRAPPVWIYDTGSSICVTGDLSLLQGIHDAYEVHSRGVSGATIASSKCGRISGIVNLSGVRYFPRVKVNLISGGILGSLGCEIRMTSNGCRIMKNGQVIGAGRLLPNKTYSVDFLDDKLLRGCPDCQH